MRKLLNIDANAKTVKGQGAGYMTAVLYLAPYKAAGRNVCPFANAAACWRDCLNTSGRGGMAKGNARFESNGIRLPDNAIQRARIARTKRFHDDRAQFMRDLMTEIFAFVKKANRKGLTPVVRLNGTSDIEFENIPVPKFWVDSGKIAFTNEMLPNIMAAFPYLQFYDYTKNYRRMARFCSGELPDNYYLCQSYSAASDKFAMESEYILRLGGSLVIVARDKEAKERLAAEYRHTVHPVVDGDETDLRFTDPANAIVILKAKGSARTDFSGFVID